MGSYVCRGKLIQCTFVSSLYIISTLSSSSPSKYLGPFPQFCYSVQENSYPMSSSGASSRRIKILLVEDIEINRVMFTPFVCFS